MDSSTANIHHQLGGNRASKSLHRAQRFTLRGNRSLTTQINDFDTAPTGETSCLISAKRSPDCREGNITAASHRENVNVITHSHRQHSRLTVTHRDFGFREPPIYLGGLTGSTTNRSAGSTPTYNGRNSRTLSFSVVIDRSQPIRSAMTVASI
ncbi:hypothetical protein A6F49_00960 [Enteractinococcus helveticum]|uniref:Uncharacterized protein n=1 Tax=Enteractinococcus helveticum TaxID=1837282 RepID=A0A1B7LVF5_9MICC|nr:hypothetical protein A6F49_00960 [Enteractinococcus helveticum]